MRFLGVVLLAVVSSVTPTFAQNTPIKHVVFIIKENRSFDFMFGTFPGANGATSATITGGGVIPLNHAPLRIRNMGHGWADAKNGIDCTCPVGGCPVGQPCGKMDGFENVTWCSWNGDNACLSQLYQSDIPNYWTYAQKFVLADNMFSSITSGSFPNHMYTVAAQNGTYPGVNGVSTLGVINSPPSSVAWGCDAPKDTLAEAMTSSGQAYYVYPCFTFTTLPDELQQAGISWRYYAPNKSSTGYVWNALDAFSQVRNTNLWYTNVADFTQFAKDAESGNLPAISWVVPDFPYSEHPSSNSCTGEGWTVGQINAVMKGPDWDSTAIFLVWDDFGSFYDHVPPIYTDFFGIGIRVPMIVISPYSVPGSITHTQYELSSVLTFIEDNWGLMRLENGHVRDAGANNPANDPAVFNFKQSPLPPLVLTANRCPAVGAVAQVLPQILAFGTVAVNGKSSLNVTVKNIGTAQLGQISIEMAPQGSPYFTQTNNCPTTLNPRDKCKITVTFAPLKAGKATSTVVVSDTDTAQPQFVAVNGTGQ